MTYIIENIVFKTVIVGQDIPRAESLVFDKTISAWEVTFRDNCSEYAKPWCVQNCVGEYIVFTRVVSLFDETDATNFYLAFS